MIDESRSPSIMKINKPAISTYLKQLFSAYEYMDEAPELTAEGYAREIANMKAHAASFDELLELKVALHHIQRLPMSALETFTGVCDLYEEEEVRAILQLAIDSDWSAVPHWRERIDQEIEFTNIPAYEWFPRRRREIDA